VLLVNCKTNGHVSGHAKDGGRREGAGEFRCLLALTVEELDLVAREASEEHTDREATQYDGVA
jgi:hypothetical protein